MIAMAKKHTNRRPGRPREYAGDRQFLQARVSQEVKEAFLALCDRNRRGQGDELLIAIENHMRAAGCWPGDTQTQPT